jgi:hypothetical protein
MGLQVPPSRSDNLSPSCKFFYDKIISVFPHGVQLVCTFLGSLKQLIRKTVDTGCAGCSRPRSLIRNAGSQIASFQSKKKNETRPTFCSDVVHLLIDVFTSKLTSWLCCWTGRLHSAVVDGGEGVLFRFRFRCFLHYGWHRLANLHKEMFSYSYLCINLHLDLFTVDIT